MPKGSKVLLIEDNSEIIEIYSTKFKQEGYDCRTANDGEKGLIEAGIFLPDIILLDVIMPKKDGFAVLKALKNDKKTKDISVILFTSLGQESDVQKGLSIGACDYIIKSESVPAQVVQKIEEVLSKKLK